MLHMRKLFLTDDFKQINTVSTSDSLFTVPNLDEGRVILAFYSFSGSAQLKESAVILTTLFLKHTDEQVELRDSANSQSGFIIRKSATTLALRSTDKSWQITCWIY